MAENDEKDVDRWRKAADELPADLLTAVLLNTRKEDGATPPPAPPPEPVYPPSPVVADPPREFRWWPYLIGLVLLLLIITPLGYEYFAQRGVTRLDWDTRVDRDRVIVMEWRTWNAIEGQYETTVEIDLSDPSWPVSNPSCVWQDGTYTLSLTTEPVWRIMCPLYEHSTAPYPVGLISSRHPYDFDVDPLFWRSDYDSYQLGCSARSSDRKGYGTQVGCK